VVVDSNWDAMECIVDVMFFLQELSFLSKVVLHIMRIGILLTIYKI